MAILLGDCSMQFMTFLCLIESHGDKFVAGTANNYGYSRWGLTGEGNSGKKKPMDTGEAVID